MKKRTSKLLSISLSALLIIQMVVMAGFTPQVSANTTPSLTVTMTYNNAQPYDGSYMTVHPVTITASSTNNKDIEYSTNYGFVWQPYTGAITVSDVGVHHYLFREVGTIPIKTANVHIMPAPVQQAITTSPDSIYYVNADVQTSGDGKGWGSAFGGLQEALDAAKVSTADSVHIYVAEGTYYPSKEVGGTGDRYKAFQMQNNVAIYGGFDASTGVRDIQKYTTILSGDLGTQNVKTDNAYHVFYHPTGTNLNDTAVLDGVTIKDGYANGSGNHLNGGGMFNTNSSPTLENVTFSGNNASSSSSGSSASGGGMYNTNNSSPTLTNVTFSGNNASSSSSGSSASGGGMYNTNSSPTLNNVTFSGNNASSSAYFASGGGMFNTDSSPTLENVTFSGNNVSAYASADGGGMFNTNNSSPTLNNVTFSGNNASASSSAYASGGGMFNTNNSSPTLNNVTFSGNNASASSSYASGGGMFNTNSSPTLNNVTFSGNNASSSAYFASGGGMFNTNNSSPTLNNVTFSGNNVSAYASADGGGMFNNSSSSPILTNVTMSGNKSTGTPGTIYGGAVTIQNSIIIGNNGEPALASGTTSTIENSLLDVVENGATVGRLYTTGNTTSTETYQSKDIFIDASKQDYRLLVKSIAIDAGDDSKNNTTTDLAGNPRIQGKRIDLGAYEAFPYDVTYEANGATGNGPVDPFTYAIGDTVTVKGIDSSFEKSGHTFAGWKTAADGSGMAYNAGDTFQMGTASVTLYAQWTVNNYTVSFDTQGGAAVASQTVLHNEKASAPSTPTKTGHTFAGWYKDAAFTTEWNFATDVVTADTTLYAKWAANAYMVTFSSDGTTVDTASVLYNEQATAPTAPTKTGHTFAGWYKDAAFTTEWDFATDVVTADTTLYAKWEVSRYTVSFDAQGGAAVASQTMLHNEQATAPSTPTKAGYTFTGWYHNGIVWDFDTPVVSDMTLTAGWKVIPSSGGGGGGYVPTPVQPPSNTEIIEVEIVDPNDPTKVYVKTKVVRKTENGRVTDTVEFTNENAQEIVKQLAGQQGTATIVLPPQPDTDETFIQLSQEAVSILAENGVQVIVSMGSVQLQLPVASLAQMTDDVTFKVTPLKEGSNDFVKDAQNAPAFANAMTVTIAGKPVRIETNTQGVPVVLTLPVDGDFAEEDLYAYISHSDGTTEVKQGRLVQFSPGVMGFQFEVDHFSVFGVVHAPQKEEELEPPVEPEPPIEPEPEMPIEEEPVVLAPYIQGYPNGTFKPNANVSRAEMALMLARFMTDDEILVADATFTDTEKHYAKDAIEVVKASGFFKGKTSTMFDPDGAITRAEMATVVVRWIQETCAEDASKSYCQQVNAEKAFTDVVDSHWAAASIQKANVYGVMTGKTATIFDSNGTLTRAEAVKVLNRLFGRPVLAEVTKSSFTDVPDTHWALQEIETAATPLIVK